MFLSPQIVADVVWPWIIRLGGPGLILLGIADNSVVPLTGSMDVLTIWLAASHRNPWPYYALMASIGAVFGGYITYAIARKGGKEPLEREFGVKKAGKAFHRFDRWGFLTIAISAVMPPPFPVVPVLLAAGALQYSRKKFIGALALGRSLRYSLLAGLGSLYGSQITAFFSRYYKPALFVLIALAVLGAFLTLARYLRRPNRRTSLTSRRRAA